MKLIRKCLTVIVFVMLIMFVYMGEDCNITEIVNSKMCELIHDYDEMEQCYLQKLSFCKCAPMLIENGYLDTVHFIIKICNETKYLKEAEIALNNFKEKFARIDSLVTNFTLSRPKNMTVTRTFLTPSYRWAQSKTNVFLEIKLAPSFDVPSYTDGEVKKFYVKKKKLFFSAFVLRQDEEIIFNLNLTLAKSVKGSKSNWKPLSVGRFMLNLTKTKIELWDKLIKKTENISYSRIWWEMKEQYESELKELEPNETIQELPAPTDLSENELNINKTHVIITPNY